MPDPWCPFAVRMPGVASGYAFGKVLSPVSLGAHYTVGRDSTNIGMNQGLYQFQGNRDGSLYQFSEYDSVCYHGGSPYNRRGPGYEAEYLPPDERWGVGDGDAIFTAASYDTCARFLEWAQDEWGLRFAYYDDPANRIADWEGVISHRSMVSDAPKHSDYWPELPRRNTPPKEDDVKGIFLIAKGGDGKVWFFNDGVRVYARSPEYMNMTAYFGQAVDEVAHEVTQSQLDSIPIWDPK